MELQSIDVKSSYFFGYAGTNWGWATWKRNWVKMDYSCEWINDDFAKENVNHLVSNINKTAAKAEMKSFQRTNELVKLGVNISYWDVQWQTVRYINHQLSIIPQKNLITNVGLGVESTHAKLSKTPKEYHSKIGKVNFCYNTRYELDDTLIHSDVVLENYIYDSKIYKTLYTNKFVGKIKSIFRRAIRLIFK